MTSVRVLFSNACVMDTEINAALSSAPLPTPTHGWHPLLNFCLILEGNYCTLMTRVFITAVSGGFQRSCAIIKK